MWRIEVGRIFVHEIEFYVVEKIFGIEKKPGNMED